MLSLSQNLCRIVVKQSLRRLATIFLCYIVIALFQITGALVHSVTIACDKICKARF